MNAIRDAARFVKKARKKMRQGEFSRLPLTLLRVEWRGDFVECDWLIRPPDPWDEDLGEQLAKTQQTLQALRDGLALRALILESFPAVTTAELRMFRADRDHKLELMLKGQVSRANEVLHRVSSVAMRAKLCGFQFVLSNGVFDRPIAA
jgi:hypothetical protein